MPWTTLIFALLQKDVVDGQRHPGAFPYPTVQQDILTQVPVCFRPWFADRLFTSTARDKRGEIDSTHPQ